MPGRAFRIPQVSVAAPSVFEIVQAAEIARSERERQAITDLMSSLTVLPLNAEAAWAAGQLSASLIPSGDQIGQMDTLIGAIARLHDEALVTGNKKHFDRIQGLRVEGY